MFLIPHHLEQSPVVESITPPPSSQHVIAIYGAHHLHPFDSNIGEHLPDVCWHMAACRGSWHDGSMQGVTHGVLKGSLMGLNLGDLGELVRPCLSGGRFKLRTNAGTSLMSHMAFLCIRTCLGEGITVEVINLTMCPKKDLYRRHWCPTVNQC